MVTVMPANFLMMGLGHPEILMGLTFVLCCCAHVLQVPTHVWYIFLKRGANTANLLRENCKLLANNWVDWTNIVSRSSVPIDIMKGKAEW